MALKYYKAMGKIRQPNPKASYYADNAAILDLTFDNAPNVVYDEIEYESIYGTNEFKTINRVRVDTVLNYNTGIILGDDFKTFIFDSEFPVTPYYGMKFKWKDSYWLVINTNSYASVINSAEVRRCNNVLRFFNDKGEKVYEPCILDYTLRFANNEDTMTITVGNGEQKIWCQRNSRTVSLGANDRFLFGNPEQRVAFRIYGGGIKNYLNSVTMDDNSPTLTEFYADHYEINPLFDDLENGFANAYLNEVSVKIVNDFSNVKVGEKYLLQTEVFKGTTPIENVEVNFSTDNANIAIVEDNTLTIKDVGSFNLVANINDTNITNSVEIVVKSGSVEDLYQIILEPDIDYLKQGKDAKISVYLFKNGVKQEDIFSFSDITENVPPSNYAITMDDNNSFTIHNYHMFMDFPVLIRCVSGEHVKVVKILLGGLY